MRSEGWIWSVSRFFRKFADEEPTKINKNLEVVRIQPSHCKFLEFPSKSWNRSIPTLTTPIHQRIAQALIKFAKLQTCKLQTCKLQTANCKLQTLQIANCQLQIATPSKIQNPTNNKPTLKNPSQENQIAKACAGCKQRSKTKTHSNAGDDAFSTNSIMRRGHLL